MSKITYSQIGGYLLPNIRLQEFPPITKPLGRYARMRQVYLREHRTMYYNTLLLSERLYHHLWDIDATAKDRHLHGVSEEVILAELVYD